MSNFTFQPTPTSPSYHDTNNSNYYEGNIQLMEARYLELCSSIRALYRSINEIREFITTNDNDNDTNKNIVDSDNNKDNNNNNNNDNNCNNEFLEAINENIILFQKQRFELYNIVNGMNNLNTKIMDVPDDIYIMVVDNDNDATTTTAISSVTAAIAAATINTTTTTTAATTTTNNDNTREDDNDDNSQQGFHL